MEGLRGPDLVPTAANWSDWVGVMVTTHFGLILGLLRAQKGPFWPKIALMGPKRAHKGGVAVTEAVKILALPRLA